MGNARVIDVEAREAAEHVARTSTARLIRLVAAGNGDLAIAEDAVAAAFERALTTWPLKGVPESPDAWLLTVARNQQRDVWKSSARRTAVPLEVATLAGADAVDPFADLDPDAIPDRRLALLFACAHPAINPDARVPLMLQIIFGFEAAQVAAVLGLPASTLTKRLTRAKRRLREAGIPFSIPDQSILPDRLPAVLEAVYGCFAIACFRSDDYQAAAPECLAGEARHLALTLAQLLDRESEAWALAALICFSLSRSGSQQGEYIPLEEQDTETWDSRLLVEGEVLLRRASGGSLGRFQLEAAMQAVHADRRRTGTTNWQVLATLSAALIHIAPTLGALVAHAAITTETAGPEAALEQLEKVAVQHPAVMRLQVFHATRAHALVRAGEPRSAHAAFAQAIDLTESSSVRTWLRKRQEAIFHGKS